MNENIKVGVNHDITKYNYTTLTKQCSKESKS